MRTFKLKPLYKRIFVITLCSLFICSWTLTFRAATAASKAKAKTFIITKAYQTSDKKGYYSQVYVISSGNILNPDSENVKLISSFRIKGEISNLLGADDKYIFFQCYTNGNSSLMRSDINGKNIINLSGNLFLDSYNINCSRLVCEQNTGINGLAGGFFFYADSHDGGELKKISIDGRKNEDLKMQAKDIFTYKGKVYFVNSRNKIIRMDPDKKNMRIISHDNVNNVSSGIVYIADDRIVYMDNERKTYSIKTDGTSKKLLINESDTYPSFLQDGWIYYTTYDFQSDVIGGSIFIEKVDGTNKQKIYSISHFVNKELDTENLANTISPYTVDENFFYYINSTYDGTVSHPDPPVGSSEIYAVKLDKSKEFAFPYAFAIVDGKAFYSDKSNNVYYTQIGGTQKIYLK